MPSILIQNFGGRVPRLSPRLLSTGAATIANMTKLWSGEVRPFQEFSEEFIPQLPDDAEIKTLYFLIDKWLAWTTDVDVVTGFTELSGQGHIYYTGDGLPKQTTYDLIKFGPPTPLESNTFPIGVNPPTVAPSVSIVGVGSGSPVVRTYVYTFYTYMNEESAPSPPSALISVSTGQSVDVDSFPATVDTNVKELRIYRSNGGAYQYVTTLAFPFPATYNDSLDDIDLGEAMQSINWYPPNPNITGMIGLACGSLAAFYGNRVAFSYPYQPGAWPPEYEKVFDYPVVALGTFGQTCVVATTGYTYLVSGTDPSSFSVARMPDPYPCVSKNSMVSGDNGCIYASADGLIFVGQGSSNYFAQYSGTHVLSRDLLTHDEWNNYNPTTINGVIFDGRYYGFYRYPEVQPDNEPVGAGFIFDASMRLVTGVIKQSEFDKDDLFIDLDYYASATFANPQVPLHVCVDANRTRPLPPPINPAPPGPVANRVFNWDAGPGFRTLTWRSKQFSFPYRVTFSAARILMDESEPKNLVFRLLDGATSTVLFERSVSNRNPFRIPSLSPRTEWMVEIEGTTWVQQVHVATSFQDIVEGKAA